MKTQEKKLGESKPMTTSFIYLFGTHRSRDLKQCGIFTKQEALIKVQRKTLKNQNGQRKRKRKEKHRCKHLEDNI